MIADKIPLCCPKTWSVDLVFAFVVGNATGETYIETPSQPAFSGSSHQLLFLHSVHFNLSGFGFGCCNAPKSVFQQHCRALGILASPPSSQLTIALGSFPGCPSGTFKASQGDEGCVHCPINSRTTSEGATNCVCRNGYYRADADPVDMPCTSMWAPGNWGGEAQSWGRRHASAKAFRVTQSSKLWDDFTLGLLLNAKSWL